MWKSNEKNHNKKQEMKFDIFTSEYLEKMSLIPRMHIVACHKIYEYQ